MRTHAVLFVLVACVATTGCNSDFLLLTFHNFGQAPLLASDEVRMSCRNKQRAEEAWRLIAMGAEKEFSCDYIAGFKEGYADYLTNGGNGDPPATPPYRYRTVRYQSQEGVNAIDQWYEGWKHGAMMAKSSGMREVEVIPLSAPPINAVNRSELPGGQVSPLSTLGPPRAVQEEMLQLK